MKIIEEKFNQVLKIVKECSEILKNAKNDKQEENKKDGSLVTKYDMLIDKKLTEELKKVINCPVLSEEHEENIGDTYFVIDPIDGTHNFSRNFECFGIMVAYVENKTTIFSIVDMPMLEKTYTAIKGKGSYKNDERIYVEQ